MAEIKDKVVTVESLKALHDYDEKAYTNKIDFSELRDIIGYDSIDNYTIALDENGEIVWVTSKTGFGGGEFTYSAKTATKIVFGKNVKVLSGCFASHENIKYIYLYPDNADTLIEELADESPSLEGLGTTINSLNRNYTYLIDLLIAINAPILFNAGETVLSSYQYGDTLPQAGIKGRIFFKKLSE